MDFGFTEEQKKLKQELREFFTSKLPQDYDGAVFATGEKLQAFHRELERKVAEKGWLTASWPEDYGGMGLGEIEQGIINEEIGYWGIFWPNLIGIHIAGPSLLLFGTEEQKRRFLPPITRGEVIWFEAFTEPEAGSDEANVQLRAIEDGEDFILNGQKTFITGAYKPDYLYTLARTLDTTPKHRGLTLFLVDGDSPGISYRPMACMGGIQTNEIFFDDVRVSKRYMLGELNRGFYHAMATLDVERTNTDKPSNARHRLEAFIQFCKETKRNGRPLIEDLGVRDTLAKIFVELEVWRLAAWRTTWRFAQRKELGRVDYDLDGFWWKTFTPRHCEAMMNIMGLYSQLQRGSKWAKLRGSMELHWQETRSLHAGGTIEIYKNILAQSALGLPRKR